MKQILLASQKEAYTESVSPSKEIVKEKTAINAIHEKAIEEPHSSFTVVAIGASAGGLEAITQLLQNISPTTGMAFIYVQHLSPDHESILSSLLSRATTMKVQDVENMDKMEPNNVYVIPYNKEIKVTDGHIQLLPRHKTYTLTIDVLFTSLAATHKENVIGIIEIGTLKIQ
jgi:two-component system CheB/CheR fusion protein